MVKRLQKVGNSNAVILDLPIMEMVGLEEGKEVQVTVSNGSIILTPVQPPPGGPGGAGAPPGPHRGQARQDPQGTGRFVSLEPIFLSVENVLTIHARMIKEFGGMPGVADRGLLESAVAIPAAAFAGELLHRDLPAMAAAYLFHLCKNHPFFDGNKRVAVVAAEVFLNLNGMRLDAADEELKQLCLGVAGGESSKDEAVAFFEKHAS